VTVFRHALLQLASATNVPTKSPRHLRLYLLACPRPERLAPTGNEQPSPMEVVARRHATDTVCKQVGRDPQILIFTITRDLTFLIGGSARLVPFGPP